MRLINKKRPFTLLEVLIAFFLTMLCFAPLIKPHVGCAQKELAFVQKTVMQIECEQQAVALLQKIYELQEPFSYSKLQSASEGRGDELQLPHPVKSVSLPCNWQIRVVKSHKNDTQYSALMELVVYATAEKQEISAAATHRFVALKNKGFDPYAGSP